MSNHVAFPDTIKTIEMIVKIVLSQVKYLVGFSIWKYEDYETSSEWRKIDYCYAAIYFLTPSHFTWIE
jgi:hypothetical protein